MGVVLRGGEVLVSIHADRGETVLSTTAIRMADPTGNARGAHRQRHRNRVDPFPRSAHPPPSHKGRSPTCSATPVATAARMLVTLCLPSSGTSMFRILPDERSFTFSCARVRGGGEGLLCVRHHPW